MAERILTKSELSKRTVGKPVAEVKPLGGGRFKVKSEIPSQSRMQHIIEPARKGK